MRSFHLLALAVVTLSAAACGATRGATADSATTIPALDSARLIADLYRLAHDSMGGRAAMTPENAKARAWIVSELQRLGLEPVAGSFEHPFAMPRRNRPDSVTGSNVLGMVRGTENPERVIVVSAHFDHVGTRNGQIFNGADDNASGTAALLQLAAHFKRRAPRHSIVFAFWDAEEMGLLGARAFVATPPIPLARIGANVNLDMVSRSDVNTLWAAGATPYPQLRPFLEAVARSAPVTLKLGHDSGGGRDDWTNQSDQGAFHAVGIPFVYFGVEDHPDYHQPTDTPERVTQGFYYNAVRTIAAFVVRLDAELPAR